MLCSGDNHVLDSIYPPFSFERTDLKSKNKCSLFPPFRVRKLKSTPIYVKPQLTSDAGACRISLLVGIRNDPGKIIDSITVEFQLPPCVLSAELSSNHGTVNILSSKVTIL